MAVDSKIASILNTTTTTPEQQAFRRVIKTSMNIQIKLWFFFYFFFWKLTNNWILFVNGLFSLMFRCAFQWNEYNPLQIFPDNLKFCRNVRKRTFWHVRPTKTQISLRIRTVWSESSLSVWRNFAYLAIQNAPSEDSDQTARMRRLIWIFAWRTCPKVHFLTLRFNYFWWSFQ